MRRLFPCSETGWATTTLVTGSTAYMLGNVASDTSKHLYDRNKAVYDLLRYGVKVQSGACENKIKYESHLLVRKDCGTE